MKTKLAAAGVIVISLLAYWIVRSRIDGGPDRPAAKPADAAALAEEIQRLGQEYLQLALALDEVIPPDHHQPTDLGLSDAAWLQRRRAAQASAPNPNTLLPKILAFAESHPTSPLAFDALFFIVFRSRFQEFRDDGTAWPVRDRALDLAWTQHKDDSRFVHMLGELAVPSRQSESFLKRALETGSTPAVRAAATYHLARFYRTLVECHKRSQVVRDNKNNATITNEERFWKLVVAPNLEQYAPLHGDASLKSIEDLLGQVIAEFSDVPAAGWEFSGPDRIIIETAPFSSTKTYGDLAASLINELTNIVPGKPAPEIVGTDADGKTFHLSDYCGQVVLLTFSADWCPGCVQFYPFERRLQEKYRDRPFVILSVSCDRTIDTLKSAIAEGKITWRCWWDGGDDGPIHRAWNAGRPSLFLLDDQHIIQDSGLSVLNSQEEFEQAIAPLLEAAAARARAAQ
jgi:peroxiredoxin